MNIQWDKAPEGVLAFHPAVNGYSDHWVKWDEKGNNWFCVTGFESGGWVKSSTGLHPKYVHELIYKKPKTCVWNGEGLPPVGTVCELRYRKGGWGEAEIKYQGRRAICVWLWVRRDGNLDQIEHAGSPDHIEFRPIRTPEQIAAEARLNKAIELYGAVMNHSGQQFKSLPEERQQHYLSLIDAGWQKVPRA